MGEKTGITWCHHTYNSWWGCTKVSEGCQFCYAERDSHRFGLDIFGPDKERRFFGEKHWQEPLRWNEAAKKAGERRRVFCMSMGDLFEDNPAVVGARHRVLSQLIPDTPWLDWLLLTKRIENVERMIGFFKGWPENIWLGYTAENQARYEERKDIAKRIPARIKFISVEPMLGPLDLYDLDGIDWVIFGAESGPRRRWCANVWIERGIEQIHAAGKKAFVKQISMVGSVSKDPADWPINLRIQEFPE